jgi:hypothetical protein
MKVLVFVKATPTSEQGMSATPDEKLSQMFADMGKFNEQLVKAGIMTEGDGLKPSSAGKRIKFSDSGATSVIDGPFAETKELVAGYWIWNVKSMDEAIEWAKRCPNPMPGDEGVLEIRPTYSPEDFGESLTEAHLEGNPNLRKQYERRLEPKARPKAKSKAKTKAKSKAAPARKMAANGKAKRHSTRAKSKK